jgi:hypothetical protein
MPASYRAIALGEDGRREVLALLGPPDQLFYTRNEVVFDYRAASHRSTNLELFLPTDVVPGPWPLGLLNAPRILFDPFEEPEAFAEPPLERNARRTAQGASRLLPFSGGIDVLILRNRQARGDRLRVVMDRDSLRTTQKELRLATGEYESETLAERILLRTD